MDISSIPTGSYALIGHYDSRDEIEKNAPRKLGGVAENCYHLYELKIV